GHTQLLSDLGTDLGGIAVDGLTAAEHDVVVVHADLLDGSSQDLRSGVSIGTAELTGGDQNGLVAAHGQQLAEHTLGGRGAHGDHHDLAAGGVLDPQSGLDSSQVVVVGDGSHGGTVHGAVFLHRHHTGGIRDLLDTNDCFHIVTSLQFL